MKYSTILFVAAAAALASGAAFADHDDWDHDHDRGHHRGWEHERPHGREEVIVVPAQPMVVQQPAVIVQQPAVVVPAQPVAALPWFEQQHGHYVYQQEYRPAVPVVGVNRCNSRAVGQVLGGIVGGVLGNQFGGGNGKTLATVGGAVTGMLVGGDIGARMDAGDQGCVGQVLEAAPVGHRVQWVQSGVTYVVVPQKVVMRGGHHCRPYTLQMHTHNGWRTTEGMACRRQGGVWVAA